MRTLDVQLSKTWGLDFLAEEAARTSIPEMEVRLYAHHTASGEVSRTKAMWLLKFKGILDLMKFRNLFKLKIGQTHTERFDGTVDRGMPHAESMTITTGNAGGKCYLECRFHRPLVDSRDNSYSDAGWKITDEFDEQTRLTIQEFVQNVLQETEQV